MYSFSILFWVENIVSKIFNFVININNIFIVDRKLIEKKPSLDESASTKSVDSPPLLKVSYSFIIKLYWLTKVTAIVVW